MSALRLRCSAASNNAFWKVTQRAGDIEKQVGRAGSAYSTSKYEVPTEIRKFLLST